MVNRTDAQLEQAKYLIDVGRKGEALDVLHAVLEYDAYNVNAWRLMAQAALTPDAMRHALTTVLQLEPNDPWARDMLHWLDARYQVARPFGGAFITNRHPVNGSGYSASIVPAQHEPVAPVRMRRSRPQRPHNALLTAVLIGVPLLLGCGIFLAVALIATGIFPRSSAVRNGQTMPLFPYAQESDAEPQPTDTPVSGARMMGMLNAYGYHRAAFTDARDQHVYNFEGTAGAYIVIEITPDEQGLVPAARLYSTDMILLANQMQIRYGERLTVTLAYRLMATGTYLVVLDGNGAAGAYQIALRAN